MNLISVMKLMQYFQWVALEILHQFYHRNQIHLITLPCIAVSLPKHCTLLWEIENNHVIKLNELIDHHTTCYTRIETITFHRTMTQHHTTNQVENDGRIPKCFDRAVWIFLSSSPEEKITYTYADLFNNYFLFAIWLPHDQFWVIIKRKASLTQC